MNALPPNAVTFTGESNKQRLREDLTDKDDTVNVTGEFDTVVIDGMAGDDTFNINDLKANTAIFTGGEGKDNFNLNNTSGDVILNGGQGDDTYTISSVKAGTVTITDDVGTNVVNLPATLTKAENDPDKPGYSLYTDGTLKVYVIDSKNTTVKPIELEEEIKPVSYSDDLNPTLIYSLQAQYAVI